MRSSVIIALAIALLIATTTSGAPTNEEIPRGCGTHDHSNDEMVILKALTDSFVVKTCRADPTLFFCNSPQREKANINVNFAFHSIYGNGNQGYLSDSDIEGQMTQLNLDYAGRGNESSRTSWQFVLRNVTRTQNNEWFSNPQRNEREFKEALAVSPYDTLNNYFTDMPPGLLGWCYFPSDFPEDSPQAGCVNLFSTIPGGSTPNYNGGQTVTHEIGHGLGLYHVFQGSVCTGNCATTGDRVCDTPPQRDSTSGCPARQDSCNDGIQDNYHNYMDYSYDDCMHLFTPGQSDRMDQEVAAHKPGYMGQYWVERVLKVVPDAWEEIHAYQMLKGLMVEH